VLAKLWNANQVKKQEFTRRSMTWQSMDPADVACRVIGCQLTGATRAQIVKCVPMMCWAMGLADIARHVIGCHIMNRLRHVSAYLGRQRRETARAVVGAEHERSAVHAATWEVVVWLPQSNVGVGQMVVEVEVSARTIGRWQPRRTRWGL